MCNSQLKGGWYRWQWRWSGKFWCPSLSATIMGETAAVAITLAVVLTRKRDTTEKTTMGTISVTTSTTTSGSTST
ncbi:unnamed protein product, partial [Rotaria sordida]